MGIEVLLLLVGSLVGAVGALIMFILKMQDKRLDRIENDIKAVLRENKITSRNGK